MRSYTGLALFAGFTFNNFQVMKKIISTSVLVLSVFFANAQADEILAEGKVSDSRTGRGIKASIRYSSIPTGGIFGRFNDSTFSFPIFGTAKYQITAEAQGYNPRTVIVDPKDIDANKKVMRDISLTPSGQTMRLQHLIFAQGKSMIDPKSFAELDEVGQMMKENSKIVIQLEGHTDNQGSSKANLALSEDRVEAVKKYLVSKGINKDRIKTKAFGGSQPLSNEMTQEARANNRRVEMRILKD
jgi:outer membrane protein OmpA-like peptidoglycan-associated protein